MEKLIGQIREIIKNGEIKDWGNGDIIQGTTKLTHLDNFQSLYSEKEEVSGIVDGVYFEDGYEARKAWKKSGKTAEWIQIISTNGTVTVGLK